MESKRDIKYFILFIYYWLIDAFFLLTNLIDWLTLSMELNFVAIIFGKEKQKTEQWNLWFG